MGGLGFGLGSFFENAASGLRTGQAIANGQRERDLDERRLQLLEEAAARNKENDAFDRDYRNRNMQILEDQNKREDETYRLKRDEYNAGAPQREVDLNTNLLDAKSKLSKSQADADVRKMSQLSREEYEGTKAKSILTGKDEAGNPTFTVEGRKFGSKAEAEREYEALHGDYMQNFYENYAPKVRDRYLQDGDTTTADVWQKWIKDKRVEKGIVLAGRMMGELQNNNIEGVAHYLGEIAKNDHYTGNDKYDMRPELLKDNAGNITGVRVTSKDRRTGQSFTHDVGSANEFFGLAMGVGNPVVMFENSMSQYKAENELIAKKNEKSINSVFEIKKKDAELANPDYMKRKIYEAMTKNGDPRKIVGDHSVPMNADEIGAEVNARFNSVFGRNPKSAGGVQPVMLMPQQIEQRVPTLTYGHDTQTTGSKSTPVTPVIRRVRTPKPAGESVDAYAARIGVPVDNRPQRTGIDDYERRVGLKR